jgi:plastocyanin
MKKLIGLFILMISFVAFTGCTQPVVPEPVTTTPPTMVLTIVPTEELTVVPTPVPTTIVTTLPPTVKRTESPSTKVVTTIHMRNNTFVPRELTVITGTGITWVNDDDAVHTVKTIGTYAGKFNSGDILPGAVWSYTFGKQEGSFEFTCSYHPEMKGTIIIKNADTSLIRNQATLTT